MKKRVISLLLALVLALGLLPTAAFAAGTGAVDDPIEISLSLIHISEPTRPY